MLYDVDGAIRVDEGAAPTDLNLTVEHVTVVETGPSAAFIDTATGTSLSVTNSVIAFNAGGDFTAVAVAHSHNLRFQNGSGNVVLDASELEADPLLADRVGRDLHLMSAAGRWEPGNGWVQDVQTSPAIDLADPAAAFALEPTQNGARANAGAYGNTPQASWSSFAGDAGLVDDAAEPDAAEPDAAVPDAAVSDAAVPDVAVPDAAVPDAGTADGAMPDGAMPDSSSSDGTMPDAMTADGASVDAGMPDMSGQIVISRAGADLQLDSPAQFTLDGTASTAPEGSLFVWTMADGPLGAGADALSALPTVSLQLAIPGIYVYQLTVTLGSLSDSDLVVVTIVDDDEVVADSCGCAGVRGTSAPQVVMAALLGLCALRRRGAARR